MSFPETNIEMLEEMNRIEQEWIAATGNGLFCCGDEFSCSGFCQKNMSRECVYIKRARLFVSGEEEVQRLF